VPRSPGRPGQKPARRRLPLGVGVALVVAALAVPALLGLLVERVEDEPVGAHFRSALGARIGRFELRSSAVRRTLLPLIVRPAGAREGERRPLLVLLHARGMPPEFFLADGVFEGLRAAGRRAPFLALVDGGAEAPWHDRRDGAWGRMVVDEAVPAAAGRLGADARRVAIGGISLGGFGALNLALARPRRFCAVGAHSPAVWTSSADAPRAAFDGPADLARHDVLARARRTPHPFGDLPVWIDRGDADPFRAGTDRLARTLRARGAALRFRTWPGGHDRAYWDAHMADWIAFYADALARCRPSASRPAATGAR
jgi:enterochelin esterase-like enzyme